MADFDLSYEAARSLKRIRPKIVAKISASNVSDIRDDLLIETIDRRLDEYWLTLFCLLHQLYGHHYDFFYYLESIALTAVDCWLTRPDDLHLQDQRRELEPDWYTSEKMVGVSLYVDLYSENLVKLRDTIPYLRDMGFTYVHLMPLFASRQGNSDGGYAISDYRSVDPGLGTIEDLRKLADDFREVGISLVLDFVFNHTSEDHTWAIQAQEGDREHRDYYLTFPDRTIPDQYERTLREIFPTIRRGNFTWHEGMKRWVWTTFNSFQWDLNYANPEVFRAMATEMLFLANTGVEILRLDAVAFIWKKMGTSCENLPEAHTLIRAFNALCRIAAPSLIFKSEAIVHPDEVAKYISREECQLSYNPTLMALLWESMATRETKLLRRSLTHRHKLPADTAWVNYLRGHDDIGWSFDDGDAWAVGIHPQHHRDFLNRFYTGRFPGSFSTGIPFQHNLDTGDMRICGTMASLAGLEQAMEYNDPVLIEMALARIRMIYGILNSMSGVPLLFMGEEWGILNDYSYRENEDKFEDSRWVHRVPMDWNIKKLLRRKKEPQSILFRQQQQILKVRKSCAALRGNQMNLLPLENPHLLAYQRSQDANHLFVLANFSEKPVPIHLKPLRALGVPHFLRDLFSNKVISTRKVVNLQPYELLWLEED